MSEPSDLLNDPSRPACGCDHCTLHAHAWADGNILQPALEQVGLTTAGPPPGASIPEVADHQRAVARSWWARFRRQAWQQLGLERPESRIRFRGDSIIVAPGVLLMPDSIVEAEGGARR